MLALSSLNRFQLHLLSALGFLRQVYLAPITTALLLRKSNCLDRWAAETTTLNKNLHLGPLNTDSSIKLCACLGSRNSQIAVRLLYSELLNHFNTWYILQELDLVVKMWPLKEQARCKSVFTFYKSQIAQLWNAFFPPRWLKLFRQTRYNLKTSCCGTDWDTILWKTSIILAP